MNYKKILLFFVCYQDQNILCNEYIYPVAKNYDFVYFVHQKKINDLQLCKLNTVDNTIESDLLSKCFPGNFTIIPNRGFSFIDQGRLRLKTFESQDIETIALEDPIYNITHINWIDDTYCYFSAKDGKNFNIYFLNSKTYQLYCIKSDVIDQNMTSNFLYPQLVNKNIYVIECSIDNRYKTKRYRYKIIKINCDDHEIAGIRFIGDSDKDTIYDLTNKPSCFLNMVSEQEGYFIEHFPFIEKTDPVISFVYNKIYFDIKQHVYKIEELFVFDLPTKYLYGTNDERLYESILPFLPRIFNKKIFYCHCTNHEKLFIDIYSFDLADSKIEKETFAINNEICFSPILINDKILYGFNVGDPKSRKVKENFLPFFEIKRR